MGDTKPTLCEYVSTCREDRELNIKFKATVLTKLESIEASIKDLKDFGLREQDSVWKAIDDLRNDIKYIYLKMGLVSGLISLVVAIVVSYIGRG